MSAQSSPSDLDCGTLTPSKLNYLVQYDLFQPCIHTDVQFLHTRLEMRTSPRHITQHNPTIFFYMLDVMEYDTAHMITGNRLCLFSYTQNSPLFPPKC